MRGNRIYGGPSCTTVIAGAPPLPPLLDVFEEIAVTSESNLNSVAVSGGGGDITYGRGRSVTGL